MDQRERRGAGLRVGVSQGEDAGHGPRRHLCREGDEQEDTPHERRVKDVVAQSAERHLADADGEECAQDDDPRGQVGRQVEGQQDARQDGRAVGNGGLALEEVLLNEILEDDARGDGYECHDECAQSEAVKRHEEGRHQCDKHAVHVLAYRIAPMNVRRRRDDQFGVHVIRLLSVHTLKLSLFVSRGVTSSASG